MATPIHMSSEPSPMRRLARGLSAGAIVTALLGRAAMAEEDPFAELRETHVDRILIADSGMHATKGEGVVWIRDPAEIGNLLAPLKPQKGGAFLCGYHHDLMFFAGQRMVRIHRLNFECRDYVVEHRGHSFQFEGQLAARWQPYIDRLHTSTGQWDIDVMFPFSVPLAKAKAAVRSAGLEVLPRVDDPMAEQPWVTISISKPLRSAGGKGHREPDWLLPEKAEDVAEPSADRPNPKLVAQTRRFLGKACSATGCSIVRVYEDLINDDDSWETTIREATLRFPSNSALKVFSGYENNGHWKIAETHLKPPAYAVPSIVVQQPTDELREGIRKRIGKASAVKLGHLRLGENTPYHEGGGRPTP